MIDFRNVQFIKSAPSISERPDGLFDIMFVGRSNVGKSSLINALCSRKDLAYTSSKPGHTKLLNYYNVDNKFYLVDAPGYGYIARGPRDAFGDMMEDYYATSKPRLVVFLFDSRRIPKDEDISFMKYLKEKEIPVLLVLTKADKLNQSGKAAINKNVKPLLASYASNNYLLASIHRKESLTAISAAISSLLKI
ncbi:MAG: ribosome biogenesis GTP-binding protein YihA/YsxC [Bacilli bacterium]|jgi:GTP-binding protein|nr:ribosome biogenesis GTP-binding protein YihA/YsxC [Bacilli bacterium]